MRPIIEVKGLSKRYKLGVFNAKTLREEAEAFLARFGRRKAELAGNPPLVTRDLSHGEPSSDFWALRDVSFDVQPGEVIGVIGRNGAGKSTLLKILSRVTEPTSGEARIRGRVASLLEVGTGFHPELTGRENIFLNGAILGMTKAEIRSKFDEIVAFSGIEKFIDTPVKRYSSGMYVRLAFAVAAHLEPEILIVDEVLAVGDAEFQKKCLGKMKDVAGHGRTVLFVSHNMAAVRSLCGRTIYMDGGRVRADGDTEVVLEEYLNSTLKPDTKTSHLEFEANEKDFQLLSARLVDDEGKLKDVFECDEPIRVEMKVRVKTSIPALYGYMAVLNTEGTIVLECDSVDSGSNVLDGLSPGEHEVSLTIPPRSLAPSNYYVHLSFASSQADKFDVESPGKYLAFSLNDHKTRRGNNRHGFFSLILQWKLRE